MIFSQYYVAFREYVEKAHSFLPQNTGEPLLFESDYLVDTVARPVLHAAVALYVTHFGLMLPTMNRIWPMKCVKSKTISRAEENLARSRVAFQITNFLGNFVVTVVGFVMEFDARRKMGTDNVQYRMEGLDDFGVLPAWQIGVQLWSFPLGLVLVKEDTILLIRHVALVSTALLPCCFRVGLRWHAPFFYGVFELSSLPLGAVALFKAQPAWMEEFPGLYRNSRIVFAIAFLVVRIFWCVPRMLLCLSDLGIYVAGLPFLSLAQLYCFVNFLGSLTLFGMQFWWGSMVVSGLVRFVVGNRGDPHPTKNA